MNKNLSIFWAHTTSTGHAYYRAMEWAIEMKRQGLGTQGYMNWKPRLSGYTPVQWETKLEDPAQRDTLVDEMIYMMSKYDLLVFQHVQYRTSWAFLKMMQEAYGKPIVTDIDDYAFDLPEMNPAYYIFTPGSEKLKITKAQLVESDALIVTTNWLKQQYKNYNDNIYVVPNCLDFKIWDSLPRKKPSRGKVRIGYSCADGHLLDKQILKKVIPAILDKYPNVEFIFLGEHLIEPWVLPFKDKGQIKVITHWKNILDYPKYLHALNFDIGLAPLRDSMFNRAKSNLRYLEYSGLKIPTVASDVVPFRESIKNGKNGFLARETKDWIKYLSKLIEDAELRDTVGLKAYWDVKKNYNLKDWVPKYFEILNKIKEKHNDSLPKG